MNENFDYRNSSLTPEERAEDLLKRMSMEEKIGQMSCLWFNDASELETDDFSHATPGHIVMNMDINAETYAKEVALIQEACMKKSRWGIPALVHIEAITGGLFEDATSFPTSIAQASTWNPELIHNMADHIRKQLVAVGARQALSPVFDIARDPRWGRLSETYGEDETLSAAMSVAFVGGLQGKDDTKAVAATGKHFVGHGLTEGGLNMGQNLITERELQEVHCKPFQAAITEADLMCVMNSYCSINREAIIGSKKILTDLLREQMKFKGILVSDYTSIDRLLNPFQLADNHVDAGILALKAGLDVEYPAPNSYNGRLIEAVEDGRLDQNLIDRSARRILELKFRLGLFDNPMPDKELFETAFADKENEVIGREIARQAITLLKNEKKTLPLNKNVTRVAVVGPHADRVRSAFGHYNFGALLDMHADRMNDNRGMENRKASDMPDGVDPGPWRLFQRFPGELRETPIHVEDSIREAYPHVRTLYQAVCDYLPEVDVVQVEGISYTGNNISGYEQALEAAAGADIVILTLGGQDGWGIVSTNGEGIDNSNIGLPGKQEQFARDIYKLGKKTVVIHIDGKPLSNEFVITHFDAIMEAWQLGEYGFEELVRIMFGEVSPSGKLPVTIARGADVLPAYYGLPRGSGYVSAGRFGIVTNPNGYVNTTAHPFYHFGHGLSYTAFEYSNLGFRSKKVDADGTLEFWLDVKNTGDMDGDEIVQVYVSDCVASMVRPDRILAGFKRVSLKKGEVKTVSFKVNMNQLAFLDIDMKWKVEGGGMWLFIGSSCTDIRISSEFEIEGDAYIEPSRRSFYASASIQS